MCVSFQVIANPLDEGSRPSGEQPEARNEQERHDCLSDRQPGRRLGFDSLIRYIFRLEFRAILTLNVAVS